MSKIEKGDVGHDLIVDSRYEGCFDSVVFSVTIRSTLCIDPAMLMYLDEKNEEAMRKYISGYLCNAVREFVNGAEMVPLLNHEITKVELMEMQA